MLDISEAGDSDRPVVPGYAVERALRRPSVYAFYRGRRLSDGAPVLLKITRDAAPDATTQLQHELDISRGLDLDGVVEAQDLVATDALAALVLQDPGGEPLDRLLGDDPLDLVIGLDCGRQLAEILARFHDRGLIHRDIQPSHVFVDVATRRVALSGLGRATSVPRETAGQRVWDRAGTVLGYIAPEQTGRVNYLVDYRADLYALGVLLFRLMTGRLPFIEDDPQDLMYAHIAQPAPSPSAVASHVPPAVSAVVLKLLAKAPEDRYQSGHGLGQDLARCLLEIEATGDVAPFDLGQHDFPARLELPQRLYGRDAALTRLTQTLEEMTRGQVGMLLVSGYSGLGKTSLLRELCQRMHLQGRYVARGKYHELERDTPYSAFHEAVGTIAEQLLGDPAERLDDVRVRLAEALGANVGVLAEVFPALRPILRDAPPVTALGPAEARNRLHLCVQRFLGAVGSKDHPLVLFLDDLQWIDRASLELLESLLTTRLDSVLVLGAYRDNEVGPDHPLTHAVESLMTQGVSVETLPLGPLDRDELQGLIVDTLHTDADRAMPLADLLYRKTAGNPFFARAFLVRAHHDGLIRREPSSGWSWNLSRIAAMEATDNVIELITQHLGRLPARSRQTVMTAAALGTSFDLPLLALVFDRPEEEIEADLMVPCQIGIVLKQGETYQFAHDRVRASAYDLIPEATRPAIHLQISRLRFPNVSERESDDRLFDLVHHLNRASALLDAAAREDAARVNLRAGQRAVATGAFREAFQYFASGLALLGPEPWTEQYAVALALHREAAEAARLVANFAEAERLVQVVREHARTLLDAVPAYETQVSVAISQFGAEEGCRLALDVLGLLGVDLIPDPQEQDARGAFLEAHRDLDGLARHGGDPALMTERTKLAAMRILTRIALASSLSNVHLYEMTVSKLVEITAADGHCPESALAYVLLGGLRCRILGDSESGHRAGTVGLSLIDPLGATAVKAFAHMIFTVAIQPWRVHPRELLAPLAEARRLGLETGDFLSATYSAFCRCVMGLWGGQDLLELRHASHEFHHEVIALGQRPMKLMFESLEAVLEELGGKEWTPNVAESKPAREDEPPPPAILLRHSNLYYAVTSCKLWGDLIFRRSDPALVSTLGATTDSIGTAPAVVPWEFLCGLAILGRDHQRSGDGRGQLLSVVERLQQQLDRRARAAPHIYRHRAALVAAEYARTVGRADEAMMRYQEAIDAAHTGGFLMEEGLANEMAAEFCLEAGYRHLAAMYLQTAAAAYGRWGARAKVSQLRERYREFLQPGLHVASSLQAGGPPDGAAGVAGALDLASIERAAAALAQQLDLGELLQRLLSILLHHTGAQRGVLLRVADGGLFVEASASVDHAERPVVLDHPLETTDDLPHSVIRYVGRSAERLVVGDTAQDDRFAHDAYLIRARPRSLLCVPVQHSGVMQAVIYLEHRQLPTVFDEARTAAVQVIASQAAVALENARLHAHLMQEVAQRQRVEDALRQALHETARLKDRLQAENLYLQEEIKGGHDFNEMIGESEAWRGALFKVEQVAATDASVLLLGETGTGKELIARALHGRSRRQAHPLVKVNCAALPATLIESELFGHEKGAFTGALTRKKGRFELADGGTLFLDEIGDLPLELQAKLLRVLQEGEFERLGSAQTLTVNVRIIAATNRDLAHAVRAGGFRADLYYRLNVFPIELPPLRARPQDIPLLVWYFVTKHQRKLGRQISHIPDEVMGALTSYAWPGNVRELENVIERALILSPPTGLVLDEPFGAPAPSRAPASSSQRLEDLEREHIAQVLAACGRRIKGKGGAAEQLGMKPSTLYTRMKKLGMGRNT